METDSIGKLTIKADIFKALGHPTRFAIMEMLQAEECAVSIMVDRFGCSMATLSKHLSVLKSSGLVSNRKQGSNVYFRTACSNISRLVEQAASLTPLSGQDID